MSVFRRIATVLGLGAKKASVEVEPWQERGANSDPPREIWRSLYRIKDTYAVASRPDVLAAFVHESYCASVDEFFDNFRMHQKYGGGSSTREVIEVQSLHVGDALWSRYRFDPEKVQLDSIRVFGGSGHPNVHLGFCPHCQARRAIRETIDENGSSFSLCCPTCGSETAFGPSGIVQ